MDEMTPSDVKRLAHQLTDMMETRGWVEYVKIVQSQIHEREKLVLGPLHDVTLNNTPAANLQEKMIALESLKGAIIGLRLAIDTPQSIIQHARDIMREEGNANAASYSRQPDAR
jgi:hypothetical protein